MREIKFRAWDGQDKLMRTVKNLMFNKNDEVDLKIEAEWFAAGPDLVLMQYTGLKDKNGVEIYEGDILCGWIGSHWHSGEDKFEEVVKYDEKTASYNFPAIEVRHGDLRVIGNIFESVK
ncbi:YopX family protein [Vagococcus carniphilus]|uniref:YopX family protein n=1 Tax=Vagococcus carniphilus TaxID=218144 RepID=UPI003BAD44D7